MTLSDQFLTNLKQTITDVIESWYEQDVEELDEAILKVFGYDDPHPYHTLLNSKKALLHTRDSEVVAGRIYLDRVIEAFEKYEPYYTATEEEIAKSVHSHLTRRAVLTRMGEGAIVMGEIIYL